jgi:hypothetical protein
MNSSSKETEMSDGMAEFETLVLVEQDGRIELEKETFVLLEDNPLDNFAELTHWDGDLYPVTVLAVAVKVHEIWQFMDRIGMAKATDPVSL